MAESASQEVLAMSVPEAASVLRQLLRERRALERLDEVVQVAIAVAEAEQRLMAKKATFDAEVAKLDAALEGKRRELSAMERSVDEARAKARTEIAELGNQVEEWRGKTSAVAREHEEQLAALRAKREAEQARYDALMERVNRLVASFQG